jgi:hypothetical protein
VGPGWLLIAVVGVLLIPTALVRQLGADKINKLLGYVLTSIVTLDMICSLGLLIAALPLHNRSRHQERSSLPMCLSVGQASHGEKESRRKQSGKLSRRLPRA